MEGLFNSGLLWIAGKARVRVDLKNSQRDYEKGKLANEKTYWIGIIAIVVPCPNGIHCDRRCEASRYCW